MLDLLRHLFARPLIALWLATSPYSWHRAVVASDSPHVHASGTHPDRILVAGDGAATGRGVTTHDLGLPGYLARSLSDRTGRAADVDIVVSGDMTAASCLTALDGVLLDRFDMIVLSLGANEALTLTSPTTWAHDLGRLVAHLEQGSPESTSIFVLAVPLFGINPHLPTWMAHLIDRHVERLNREIERLVADRSRVTLVPPPHPRDYRPEGMHIYHEWAEAIAARIDATLDPDRPAPASTAVVNERERQRALAEFANGRGEQDPALDLLTEKARRVFGTRIAVVSLIESDSQQMRAATGIEPIVLPREEAFCDITIRRPTHFVIEDTLLDFRYADYAVVTGDPGIRFYAGYPIESRSGQRVGALCVMDSEPRRFSDDDAAVLRELAQQVQRHLWQVAEEG